MTYSTSAFRSISLQPMTGGDYPASTLRIDYVSDFDGAADWALFLPGDNARTTVVYLHGSFAGADQIFTRPDIRNHWLPRILAGGHSLLSVNMRDTSYMSPPAAADMRSLLLYLRTKHACGRFVLLGGSGGASSAMAYAVLHPEDLHGVVAMGMCDIFTRVEFARRSAHPVLQDLAKAIFAAYGGTPEELPEVYRARSVLAHTDRLTMRIVLTMGESDPLIPVEETRRIAAALAASPHFQYHEVPGGDHDSALWIDVDFDAVRLLPHSDSQPSRQEQT